MISMIRFCIRFNVFFSVFYLISFSRSAKLCKSCSSRKVLGLDLTPRVEVSALINSYMHATICVDIPVNERLKFLGFFFNIRITTVARFEVLPNLQIVATERGLPSFFVSAYACSILPIF